jgi:hypothetical protein
VSSKPELTLLRLAGSPIMCVGPNGTEPWRGTCDGGPEILGLRSPRNFYETYTTRLPAPDEDPWPEFRVTRDGAIWTPDAELDFSHGEAFDRRCRDRGSVFPAQVLEWPEGEYVLTFYLENP